MGMGLIETVIMPYEQHVEKLSGEQVSLTLSDAKLADLLLGLLGVLIHDLESRFLGDDERIWRDAMHERNVCADGTAFSEDGLAAENGGVRINGDVVFDIRMPLGAAHELATVVLGEAAGSEGDAVVEFDVVADLASLANDDAGAVVDEEMSADACSWMNIDASA